MLKNSRPGIISTRSVVHFQGNRTSGRVKETGTVAGLHGDDDVEATMLKNLDLGQTHENLKIGEELDTLVGLNHPYLLAIRGICLSPLCLVAERFPKRSLKDVMKTWQHTDTSPKKKLELLEKIAEGMKYLHNQEPPIPHKNLNPTNVMMKGDGTPLITGFGFHRYRNESDEVDPKWLSCEVANGQEASTKSDVYSFGILMWEVLTGKNPWVEEDGLGIWYKLEHGQHPVLYGNPKSWAGYKDLVLLVNQCLSTAPANRPDFSEIVEGLKDSLWKIEYGKALGCTICRNRLMGGWKFLTKIFRCFCGCFNQSKAPLEPPLIFSYTEGDEDQKRSSNVFNKTEFKKDDGPSPSDVLQTKTRQEDSDDNVISCTRFNQMLSLAIGWGEHCEKIQDSDWQKFLTMIPEIDTSCGKEITELKVPKKESLMDIRKFLMSHINMETTDDMKSVQEENIDRWIGSCHGINHPILKKLLRLVRASLESYNDEVFKEIFETVEGMALTSSSV